MAEPPRCFPAETLIDCTRDTATEIARIREDRSVGSLGARHRRPLGRADERRVTRSDPAAIANVGKHQSTTVSPKYYHLKALNRQIVVKFDRAETWADTVALLSRYWGDAPGVRIAA